MSERETNLGRIGLWITACVSAFALAYVAYVHVLAHARRMSPDVRDFLESFASRDGLPPDWEVIKKGNLEFRVAGGALEVHGSGDEGDEIAFVMPQRRFDDGAVRLSFRVPRAEGVEVFVGFEKPGTKERIGASFVADQTPFVYVGGDTSAPFRQGHGTEDAQVTASPGELHTLALDFNPAYGVVGARFDGRPMASLQMGWFQGSEARLRFGVRLRKPVAEVAVGMASIGMETLDWARAKSFEEHFGGEFIDVSRWSFIHPPSSLGHLDVSLVKDGLRLDGAMTGLVVDPVSMFLVRTHPFPLQTMRIETELTIDQLDQATFFVGIMGASAWSNPGKVFDIAITRRDGEATVFPAGAYTGNGAISAAPGLTTTLGKRLSLELRYDASDGVAVAVIDGKPSDKVVLDLKPADIVAVRIGAIGHAPDAHVTARVHQVQLEVR